MNVVAIVNPVSGARSVAGQVGSVGAQLRAKGFRFQVRTTAGPGDATRIAQSIDGTADAVVAVGGDGTVRDVLGGLAESNKPLVVMTGGTENLVARELGMPSGANPVIQAILSGRVRECDVGLVNGRRFLVITGIGFDAEVVQRLTRLRRGHITQFDYLWPIWRTFWGHRFPRLRAVVDGELIFDGRGLAFVGITRQYAQRLRILPLAQPDDGLLDVCIFPCGSRLELLGHAYRTVTHSALREGGVVYRQGQSIEITSPDVVPLEVDGDYGGTLPATFSILPKAAKFLVPPN